MWFCGCLQPLDAYSPRAVWMARCGIIGVAGLVIVAFIVAYSEYFCRCQGIFCFSFCFFTHTKINLVGNDGLSDGVEEFSNGIVNDARDVSILFSNVLFCFVFF